MDEASLQNQLISIEKELLALKQKRGYISSLSAGYYRTNVDLNPGRHTIVYEDGDYPIISFFFTDANTELWLTGTSTPKNNEQYFWIGIQTPIQIISTRKIISVQ